MCREEAHKLWERQSELEAKGVGLICVVKEEVPGEMETFSPKLWGGPIYVDEKKDFFKFVSGGKLNNPGYLSLMSGAVRANLSRAGTYLKTAGEDGGNLLTGEGMNTGGLVVLRPGDGGVEYVFKEEKYGNHAPWEEVLAAATAAAAGKS